MSSTYSIVALSPGPFFADSVAIATRNLVKFYLKIKHLASGRSADKSWRFTSNVDSLVFAPNGRKLAISVFKEESIVVCALDSDVVLELSEPCSGAGLISVTWPLEDWIMSFADYGLHMSLWHPQKDEIEPDRVSKPNRSKDDPSRFVVDTFSSGWDGDYVAVAHGERDLSVFRCESWDRRWSVFSTWSVTESINGIEQVQFIDQSRILLLSDSLIDGILSIWSVQDGEELHRFGHGITGLRLGPVTPKRLVYWREVPASLAIAVDEKLSNFGRTEFFEANLQVLHCEFSADAQRIAILSHDPMGFGEGIDQALVVRKDLTTEEGNKDNSYEVSLTVPVSSFIGFKWDPTSRDRLLVILKKQVILWRRQGSPEIISRLNPSTDIEHVNAEWSGTGGHVLVTLSSIEEPPIIVNVLT